LEAGQFAERRDVDEHVARGALQQRAGLVLREGERVATATGESDHHGKLYAGRTTHRIRPGGSGGSSGKGTIMRALCWAVVFLLVSAPVGLGQDVSRPEELKKMYDEALVQLKSAQDRKSQLAKENERLSAQVEELKKDLAAAQAEA